MITLKKFNVAEKWHSETEYEGVNLLIAFTILIKKIMWK